MSYEVRILRRGTVTTFADEDATDAHGAAEGALQQMRDQGVEVDSYEKIIVRDNDTYEEVHISGTDMATASSLKQERDTDLTAMAAQVARQLSGETTAPEIVLVPDQDLEDAVDE